MERVNVTTADGEVEGWFDYEKATVFEEDAEWDGSSHISVNTGTFSEHQRLILTAGERWVLYHWSQWDSVLRRAEFIGDSEAARWLIRNKLDADHETHFGPVPEETGPDKGGRPYVGEQQKVRLPPELLDLVISDAAATGRSRSETIRVRLGERYDQMRKKPTGGSDDA